MILDNSNWIKYALSVYDINNNLEDEIYDDLKQIQNLKKYLNFYIKGNSKFIRHIINTIIILNNSFTVQGAFNLILFKLNPSYHSIIKTCYCYLKLIDINGDDIKLLVNGLNIKNIEIDNDFLKNLYTYIS